MTNRQNAPTGKTGRPSPRPSPGVAPDYKIHPSDTDTLEHNLQVLPLAIGIIAGLAALAIGILGLKQAKTLAAGQVRNATDKAEIALREPDILSRKPGLQQDPTLAARLIDMVDREQTIMVCEVERKKGQRSRISRRYRGQIVIHQTISDIYFFAVIGSTAEAVPPIIFTIRDIDNLFNLASGCPCLTVGTTVPSPAGSGT